jgi:hypothetical protein
MEQAGSRKIQKVEEGRKGTTGEEKGRHASRKQAQEEGYLDRQAGRIKEEGNENQKTRKAVLSFFFDMSIFLFILSLFAIFLSSFLLSFL